MCSTSSPSPPYNVLIDIWGFWSCQRLWVPVSIPSYAAFKSEIVCVCVGAGRRGRACLATGFAVGRFAEAQTCAMAGFSQPLRFACMRWLPLWRCCLRLSFVRFHFADVDVMVPGGSSLSGKATHQLMRTFLTPPGSMRDVAARLLPRRGAPHFPPSLGGVGGRADPQHIDQATAARARFGLLPRKRSTAIMG